MKRRKLKNSIQKSGERLQDNAADIQRLAQEAYSSMNPEFVESAVVDSLVDGIRNWKVQSLVCMHSYKNITATLTYALEVEAVRKASCGLGTPIKRRISKGAEIIFL